MWKLFIKNKQKEEAIINSKEDKIIYFFEKTIDQSPNRSLEWAIGVTADIMKATKQEVCTILDKHYSEEVK